MSGRRTKAVRKPDSSPKYSGVTERGRRVVERSFDECAASLAFVMSMRPADLVIVGRKPDKHTKRLTWLVYPSQAAADADTEHGNWIALITYGSARL